MRRDSSEEDDRGYESDEKTAKPADGDAFQKGNTLDYYNEDLSRKAVGRLFSDGGGAGREEGGSEEDFVKGFSERPERPGKPGRPGKGADGNPYEDEDMRERRRDKYDKYDKGAEKGSGRAHNPGARPDKNDVNSIPEPSPAVRVTQNKAGASVPKATQNPGRLVSGDSPYASGKRRPGLDDDGKNPSGEDYSQFKRKYDDRDYVTGPRKRATPPRGPGAGGAGDAKRAYADDGYEEPENSGLLKIVFGVLAVVFLVVLAILCFKINSVSAQLHDAQNKLSDAPNYEDYNSIKIENEKLASDNDDLRKSVDDLTARLAAAGYSPQASAPPDSGDAVDTRPPADGGASDAEWPKAYTVVSGDSLSKIAKNFYGSSSQANVDKIKNYNNLTSDNINIGDTLQIPK